MNGRRHWQTLALKSLNGDLRLADVLSANAKQYSKREVPKRGFVKAQRMGGGDNGQSSF